MRASHRHRNGRPGSARQTTTASRVQMAGAIVILLGCASIMLRGYRLQVTSDPAQHDLQLAREFAMRRVGDDDPQTSEGLPDPYGGASIPQVGDDALAPAKTTQAAMATETVDDTEPPIVQPPLLTVPVSDPAVLQPGLPESTTSYRLEQENPSIQTVALSSATTPRASAAADEVLATTAPTLSLDALIQQQCYNERDLGIIDKVVASSRAFCPEPYNASETAATKRTKVTLYDLPSLLRSVVFEDLLLDLTTAKPRHPIRSMAQDGGSHDPRLAFQHSTVFCACDEFKAFSDQYVEGRNPKKPLNVWDPALAFVLPRDQLDASLSCAGNNVFRPVDAASNALTLEGKVVLLARRDDHNPFFQISSAVNAWVMLRALEWDPADVTLVHLDAGYPSPIDELHKKLVAPAKRVLEGTDILGKRLLFTGEVMLAPFETTGPMMQHLDDAEPCLASELFQTFRDESLAALDASESSTHDSIVVTIISRKPYDGRIVQRRWLNEDEVVAQLRKQYVEHGGKPIVFQSIDFVGIPLQQQMQLMLDSDVVISMHGAGLVNVMWTRPGTLVLEIFPAQRKRWGYRNLCQHLGCDWHEFRGGRDVRTGREPNANDKMIHYDEWVTFFDPLFQARLAAIATSEDVSADAVDADGAVVDAAQQGRDARASPTDREPARREVTTD